MAFVLSRILRRCASPPLAFAMRTPTAMVSIQHAPLRTSPALSCAAPCRAAATLKTIVLEPPRLASTTSAPRARRAATLLGGDEPRLVKQAVGARHGIKVHPQIGCQRPHSGELVAGFKRAAGNLLAHLFHNLNVDGNIGT